MSFVQLSTITCIFVFPSKNHTWLEQTARLCHSVSSKMWSQQPILPCHANDAWGNENGRTGDYHYPDVTQCVAGNHVHWHSFDFLFYLNFWLLWPALYKVWGLLKKWTIIERRLCCFKGILIIQQYIIFCTCQHTLVYNTVATNKNSITMNHGSIWWNN